MGQKINGDKLLKSIFIISVTNCDTYSDIDPVIANTSITHTNWRSEVIKSLLYIDFLVICLSILKSIYKNRD